MPLFMRFIDIVKAYDSVNRELLWKVFLSYPGLRKRLIKRADILRRHTVKFKAVLRCFIVVSGRLRRRFRRSE
jgi:hypothetical protein